LVHFHILYLICFNLVGYDLYQIPSSLAPILLSFPFYLHRPALLLSVFVLSTLVCDALTFPSSSMPLYFYRAHSFSSLFVHFYCNCAFRLRSVNSLALRVRCVSSTLVCGALCALCASAFHVRLRFINTRVRLRCKD